MGRFSVVLILFASLCCAANAKTPAIGLLYTPEEAAHLPQTDKLSDYTKAITDNGGEAVPLSQLLASTETAARLERMDGLLIPGGDDIAPDLYGQRLNPKTETVDRAFDLYELDAVKKSSARGIPMLGICKGHQLLNIWAGGGLYQDIPSQLRGGKKVVHRIRENGKSKPCFHEISVRRDSLLYSLLKTARIRVNSYHHQGLDKIGGGFAVSAVSGDGLAEAVEKGNILSVQFHPEKLRKTEPVFNSVFVWFISAAGGRGGK
ncbi:MAG: gamma-glutamyl-gamma-aminobutyrate hydrolase family protein [Elusimicrobiales bacterium]